MRKLFVVAVVICAVIGEGWAQSRGSVRYVASEDFDGDITRAPRPSPTRGSARRQRPTASPELAVVEDELKAFQPPETSIRTGANARRIPQPVQPQEAAPLPAPVPAEPIARLAEDLPHPPPADLDGRPPNKRRRRPKKRRKPVVTEDPTKEMHIAELITDERKRTDTFQTNPQLRNTPSDFHHDPEKSSWAAHENPSAEQPQRNAQYFGPQPSSNRLPIEHPEPIDNSRRYIDSSSVLSNTPDADAYSPETHPVRIPNEASYVPVLNPVRVPSEESSRLPPDNYPHQDGTRPSDHDGHPRPHSNTFPVPDPNEIILNTGAKPLQDNNRPTNHESSLPTRETSEIRLPPAEPPLLSPEYTSPNFDSEGPVAPLETNPKPSDETDKPANRLPNPSEIHYDSVYPEYSETPSTGSRAYAGRRQEPTRTAAQSYTSSRRSSGTKPLDYDNDAEIDRSQASQYQPPLQRAGSRYRSDETDVPPRSRASHDDIPATPAPRGRGSARYPAPESSRGTSRYASETSSDPPARARGSQAPASRESSQRIRGSQRYTPETAEDVPAQSTRRQPARSEPVLRDPGYGPPPSSYVPLEDIISDERRAPLTPARSQPPLEPRSQDEPEDYAPVRQTLRARPQYEGEPAHSYERSTEDAYPYDPDYSAPRQTGQRTRTDHRNTVSRQQQSQPPQPEYQAPPNRQRSRQDASPQYEAPQNPRSRPQPPQYQAPQNPRQASPRSSSRSNQEDSEPRNKPAGGGVKFKCPEPYGFFPDPVQCDKYYECRNGTAEMNLCNDGLAFNEISAPKYLRCDSLRDVDCKSRPELQEPQPTENCPRRFGLFPHETDCTRFWNCVDGASTEVQCPPGLTYSDERATCDWADLVENSCKSEDLLGFKCPEPTGYELQDGVYSRYPHPSDCQLHFTCIKGADGIRRPRMLSCNEGLVFDPSSGSCTRSDDVPGCEDYYGPRSDPPKRKPAKQPSPPAPVKYEEEPLDEEPPTPRPRRRGSSRRSRN